MPRVSRNPLFPTLALEDLQPQSSQTSASPAGAQSSLHWFLAFKKYFFKGSLGSNVDQHECWRKEAPCFP